jgi:hypothetical protein
MTSAGFEPTLVGHEPIDLPLIELVQILIENINNKKINMSLEGIEPPTHPSWADCSTGKLQARETKNNDNESRGNWTPVLDFEDLCPTTERYSPGCTGFEPVTLRLTNENSTTELTTLP